MLQKIGDAFINQRWLTYILFGALSVIFAAWGAYGIATIQFNSSNNAAKVNGVTIPYASIRNAWMQRQADWERQFGGAMPASVKRSLENQLLEQYIRDTLMATRTEKLGYRVSDLQLAEAIREEPAFQLEGQYSAELAKTRLQQAGISEQAYESDLKQSLRIGELDAGIEDSDFLTPEEVKRLSALESEEREAEYVRLPASKYVSTKPIDDASVKAYYEAHQTEFMTPEYVSLRYAELDLSQVLAETQVSDQDLESYYAKHKSEYVTPERRRARHILIAINAHRSAAAALARAKDVLAKLKGGASFAQLAKQYSDDAGSAAQGGELGWADRSAFAGPMKPVADALFSMKAGEVSAPVRAEDGYHIIELEGIEPGETKTFAEVRSAIEPIVRRIEASDQFGNIQEQIQEQLDEGAPSLESLANTFGMKLGEVPQFIRGKGGAPLGDSRDLEQTVFGHSVLDEHHIGGPVPIGNDRMVLVTALSHHLPAPRPISQVRDTIVAALRQSHANAAALEAAQGAVKELRTGAPFATVVQSLGVTPVPARLVGRDDPSVPSAIRSRIFTSPKPQKGQPVYEAFALPSGGAALIGVTGVDLDAPENPAFLESTLEQVARNYGRRASNDYVEQARLTAKVKKNLSVFD